MNVARVDSCEPVVIEWAVVAVTTAKEADVGASNLVSTDHYYCLLEMGA